MTSIQSSSRSAITIVIAHTLVSVHAAGNALVSSKDGHDLIQEWANESGAAANTKEKKHVNGALARHPCCPLAHTDALVGSSRLGLRLARQFVNHCCELMVLLQLSFGLLQSMSCDGNLLFRLKGPLRFGSGASLYLAQILLR